MWNDETLCKYKKKKKLLKKFYFILKIKLNNIILE